MSILLKVYRITYYQNSHHQKYNIIVCNILLYLRYIFLLIFSFFFLISCLLAIAIICYGFPKIIWSTRSNNYMLFSALSILSNAGGHVAVLQLVHLQVPWTGKGRTPLLPLWSWATLEIKTSQLGLVDGRIKIKMPFYDSSLRWMRPWHPQWRCTVLHTSERCWSKACMFVSVSEW